MAVPVRKRGRIIHHVVFVFAGALVEGIDLAQEEVGDRVTSDAAVEREMARAAELVANRHGVVLQFAAHLDVVLAFHPGQAVVVFPSIADERRLEVVADVEVPDGLDLRNRR